MAEMLVGPLAHRADDLANVAASTRGTFTVVEVVGLTQLDLRVDAGLTERGSLQLPLKPSTVSIAHDVEALRLGPDEWLVVAPLDSGSVVERLQRSLDGLHHSLVDVSANRAILDVGGERRHVVLEAGCGIDLHPRVWFEGRCVETLLARAPVILQARASSTRVFVRPSFANYLVDWLLHAVADEG